RRACSTRFIATTRRTRSPTRRTRSTTSRPPPTRGSTCSGSCRRCGREPLAKYATLGAVIGLVLSCEHASWTLPPGVDLGVPTNVLQSQSGWDHGAFDIASRLSEAVGLSVHAGLFTRMFVDLN